MKAASNLLIGYAKKASKSLFGGGGNTRRRIKPPAAAAVKVSSWSSWRTNRRPRPLFWEAAHYSPCSSSTTTMMMMMMSSRLHVFVRFQTTTSTSAKKDNNNNDDGDDGGNDIADAQIVRERYASNHQQQQQQQQQEDDEWNALEQKLQQALLRHEKLVAESDGKADDDDDEHAKKIYQSLQHLRDCYENMTYWEEALRLEQELLDQFESSSSSSSSSSPDLHAANLYRQGKLYMRLDKHSKAAKLYQEALDLYDSCSSSSPTTTTSSSTIQQQYHALKGNILISMAGIPYHRGKWEESLHWLEQAEPHFVFHGQNKDMIDSSSSSNTTTTNNNNIQPHPDLIKCLQHQGLLHRTMQEFELALECYERAWQVLEQLQKHSDNDDNDDNHGNPKHNVIPYEKRQSLLMDLADMHLARDEYNQAETLYQQILQEDQEQQQQQQQQQQSNSTLEAAAAAPTPTTTPTALDGVILHNLGKIHAQRQEYDAAVDKLHRAVVIKQQLAGDFHPEVAKTLNALGAVYAVQNEKVKALECFQQALLIARMHSKEKDESDPQIMLALRNIAVVRGEKVPKWGSSSEDNNKNNKG